jgi:hypothetical protein
MPGYSIAILALLEIAAACSGPQGTYCSFADPFMSSIWKQLISF